MLKGLWTPIYHSKLHRKDQVVHDYDIWVDLDAPLNLSEYEQYFLNVVTNFYLRAYHFEIHARTLDAILQDMTKTDLALPVWATYYS